MIKGLLFLIGGTLAFGVAATAGARFLWPDEPILTWSATAGGLCLLPTALTLAWTRWAHKGQPEQQLLAVFGGTAVRMVLVLAVGLMLFFIVPAFQYQRFWIFIVVYYLFTLTLEMILIVRGAPGGQAQPKS